MSNNAKYALTTLLLVTIFIAAAYLVPAKEVATDLVGRIRDYGAIAPIVYFFLYLVAGVAGFSRTILTIIAGIVFEPLVAAIVVILATMAVFMCTFLIARYFAADWVAARLRKIPTAKTLISAVEEHGFRLLVLMRLNPFVPGVVNGYGFGMTSIKPLPYLIASMLGSLPLTLIYVYLGYAGGEALLRDGAQPDSLQRGTLLFGIVLSAILLIAISWYGHRAVTSVGSDASLSDDA